MNLISIFIILVMPMNSFTIFIEFSSMKFLSFDIISSDSTYVTDNTYIHLALVLSVSTFSMNFVTISIILMMSVNFFTIFIVLGSMKLLSVYIKCSDCTNIAYHTGIKVTLIISCGITTFSVDFISIFVVLMVSMDSFTVFIKFSSV